MDDCNVETRMPSPTGVESSIFRDKSIYASISKSVPSCRVWTNGQVNNWQEHACETTSIEAIEMRDYQLDKQYSLENLNQLFQRCQDTMHSIHFEDCLLSDRVLAFLAEKLAQNKVQLSHVVFRNCRQVTMTSLIAATTLFSPTLVSMELSSCRLARQAGIILGQSLQICTSLRRIVLADNSLRDGGLRAIADASRERLSTTNELELLDITGNGITAMGLKALNGLRIQQLIISNNSISSLSTLLLTNPVLQVLNLSENPLSEDGFHELMNNIFNHGKLLQEVNIQFCNVSLVGEAYLAKLLMGSSPVVCTQFRRLLLGERPTFDDEEDSFAEERFTSVQRAASIHFPALRIELPENLALKSNSDDEDDEESNYLAREGRLELLERKEFLRRHSEENLENEGDERLSLSGPLVPLVTDVLEQETGLPTSVVNESSPGRRRSHTSSSKDLNTELLQQVEVDDHRSFPSTSNYDGMEHTSSGLRHGYRVHYSNTASASPAPSLLLSPSLDDVASHFSIDHDDDSTRQGRLLTPHQLSSLPPAIRPPDTPIHSMDVEYIVNRTIENMNRAFEQRMSQFLSRMELQQQEKVMSQLQTLSSKVEACERAIPRLEARVDGLADRVAVSGAQIAKVQSDVHAQLLQVRHECKQLATTSSSSNSTNMTMTTPLTPMMQHQVEDLIATRVRASEQSIQTDVSTRLLLRQTTSNVASPTSQTIVDTVTTHLKHFKQEFETNQSNVLRNVTDNITRDEVRLETRLNAIEGKITHLENVIQSEQQASLLALEAISEAFQPNGPNVNQPPQLSQPPLQTQPQPTYQQLYQQQQLQQQPQQRHSYQVRR